MCNKSFQQKWNLRTHIARIHLNSKPFQCGECDKTFGYSSHFKRHVKQHFLKTLDAPEDVKKLILNPNKCAYCDQSFATKYLLSIHILTHTGKKPHTCSECFKTFGTKRGAEDHFRRIHSGKPTTESKTSNETSSCPICGKNIARHAISKHMNIHTRRRVYLCNFCGKEFLESNQRKMHERTHTGEKPFICDFCGKEHAQLGNLQLHLQRKHSKSNEPESTIELGKNVAECTGNETIEEFREIAQRWKQEQVTLEIPEEKKLKVDQSPEIPNVVSSNVREKVFKDTLDKLLEELTESGLGDQANKVMRKAINKNSKRPLLSIFLNLLKWDLNGLKTIRKTKAGIMWRCWTCRADLKSQSLFIRHRFIHEEQRPFQCEFCKKTFAQSGNLKEHIMMHQGTNNIFCQICGAAFRHKSHFKVHLARHPNAPQPARKFTCDFCQKIFWNKTHIRDHIRIHTLDMPFVCHTCGRSFITKSSYVRHSKSHSDLRDHQCHICPRAFNDRMSLKRHLISHSGVKKFECECGKRFTQSGGLNKHRKVCLGLEKPQFQCIHCEKCFYTRSDQKRHIFTHETSLQFQCSHCGSYLKSSETLRRHIAAKHKYESLENSKDCLKANDSIPQFIPFLQGKCGVAVIRVSGRNAECAILKMTPNKILPKPRTAKLCSVLHPITKEKLDLSIVVWFPSPNSFTGENSCEFQVHGGIAVINAVLSALGCIEDFRLTLPGEFTRRAFLNGKMDLTEVEGLADIIQAETEEQRKQALSQLEGNLGKLYAEWRITLIKLLSHIEAYMDFSEEQHLEDNILENVKKNLNDFHNTLNNHLNDSRQGERLRNGIRTVILGPPNVGKSSLLNYLVKRPAAIVAPVAGTTRDIIEQCLDISGYPLIIADTAGLRNEPVDEIEKEGIKRAVTWTETADLILLMSTIDSENTYTIPANIPVIKICNKIDKIPNYSKEKLKKELMGVSCKTEQGMEEFLTELTQRLKILCGEPGKNAPSYTRQRHKDHLQLCVKEIEKSIASLEERTIDISAHHLRKATKELASIAGEVSTEDILNVIFQDFCVGK